MSVKTRYIVLMSTDLPGRFLANIWRDYGVGDVIALFAFGSVSNKKFDAGRRISRDGFRLRIVEGGCGDIHPPG